MLGAGYTDYHNLIMNCIIMCLYYRKYKFDTCQSAIEKGCSVGHSVHINLLLNFTLHIWKKDSFIPMLNSARLILFEPYSGDFICSTITLGTASMSKSNESHDSTYGLGFWSS